MDKLQAMHVFTKVVAAGSFAEAGRQLGLTRSAVSKGIVELEHILGARLLDRTTRKVRPTEAGLTYYERCVDIIAQVDETELQISRLHDEPKGVLRLNAPVSFGTLYLGDAVADFMSAYPELKVEMVLNDRFIDPIEEGMDVTVRIANLQDSSLIARKLAPAGQVLAASPKYLKQYGVPQTPDELSAHRCLNYGHTTVLQQWQLYHDGAPVIARINSAMCSNNGDVLRAAALASHGIVKLPTFIIGPDIKAGRLSLVLEEYRPPELGIYALYAPNRYLAAKTRVLVDFLVERYGANPRWDDFEL
jgi:DNA-binding transcriptional LysR family regulator